MLYLRNIMRANVLRFCYLSLLLSTVFSQISFAINNDSCSYMLAHSPKNSVVESTAKDAMVGGLMGALAGFLVDRKNRTQGALLGALTGMAAGVGYSYYKNQYKLRTSPEDLAKQINYDYKSPYFRFENIIIEGKTFRPGQYIPLTFRFYILKPKNMRWTL